jgi:hypothetical protein
MVLITVENQINASLVAEHTVVATVLAVDETVAVIQVQTLKSTIREVVIVVIAMVLRNG